MPERASEGKPGLISIFNSLSLQSHMARQLLIPILQMKRLNLTDLMKSYAVDGETESNSGRLLTSKLLEQKYTGHCGTTVLETFNILQWAGQSPV